MVEIPRLHSVPEIPRPSYEVPMPLRPPVEIPRPFPTPEVPRPGPGPFRK